MSLWRRKPKFAHPCPACQRAGREYPHGGQHVVGEWPPSVARLKAPPAPPPPAVRVTVSIKGGSPGNERLFLEWLKREMRKDR